MVVERRQLLVNRRPVLIQGVNRHEHDERRGKAVTEAGMLADVRLMKQLNFNAVRCSHYPNAMRWSVPPKRGPCPCMQRACLGSHLVLFDCCAPFLMQCSSLLVPCPLTILHSSIL